MASSDLSRMGSVLDSGDLETSVLEIVTSGGRVLASALRGARVYALLVLLAACGDKAGTENPIVEDTGLVVVDSIDNDGDGFFQEEDCDDNNNTIHPDANELCDGVDNDCDGEVDGTNAIDGGPWFVDSDGDSFGEDKEVFGACELLKGYSENDEDCDDGDSGIYPDAPEVCDGVDQDCDGEVDESANDKNEWFYDDDGDSFGNPDVSALNCDSEKVGYVDNGNDCDDNDADVHPDVSADFCDGVDVNCDGVTDEDCNVWGTYAGDENVILDYPDDELSCSIDWSVTGSPVNGLDVVDCPDCSVVFDMTYVFEGDTPADFFCELFTGDFEAVMAYSMTCGETDEFKAEPCLLQEVGEAGSGDWIVFSEDTSLIVEKDGTGILDYEQDESELKKKKGDSGDVYVTSGFGVFSP
jgi:hypothetical protein